MSKRSNSRHDLKIINKFHAKVSNKYESSISNISRSYYGSSLYSDSEWYERRQTDECKNITKLDHIVTNNIKNKNQCDDAI